MSLKEYHRKRDFKKTREPRAGSRSRKGAAHFVVQKHDASRLHYDFRLEMDGVLKSWALPKGLPFKHGEKHLAVHVEDHPVAYGDFEGTIPKGQYGGGTVMLWDRGTYDPLTTSPLKDLGKGKLHFELHGEKLHGEWYLVRFRKEDDQWLIIRGGDDARAPSLRADDRSVASGRTMKQLSRSDAVWESKPRKQATRAPKAKPIKAKPSLPLPDFVEAMNARLVDEPPSGDWTYEIKFDGWRALVLKSGDQARMLSRNRKDFGDKFPDLVADFRHLDVRDAILDGEVVALDEQGRSSFQTLQAALTGDELPPLYYYAFDLLRLDGHDLRKEPLEKRKDLLREVIQGTPDSIRFSDSLGRNYTHLSRQARKLGLEGLIGKRPDSAYESGRRSGTWIKLKFSHEQEMVIAGYTPPQGSREHFGALLLGYYQKGKLHAAGKVGTGFTQDTLRSLAERFKSLKRKTSPFAVMDNLTPAEISHAHWLRPELVAQVHFKEWTREGRLRQPVFLGLREDKAARDVVREIA